MNKPFAPTIRGIGLVWIICIIALSACQAQTTNTHPPAARVENATPKIPGDDNAARSYDQLREDWLAGVPCKAPCWEGITPGETLAEAAIEKITATAIFINSKVNREYGYIATNLAAVDDTGEPSPIYVIIDFTPFLDGGTVQMISLWFPPAALGQLINAFGEPTHIYAWAGNHPEDPDETYWRIEILWLPAGLAMGADGQGSPPSIDEALSLSAAMYFIPELETYLDHRGYQRAAVQNWAGYGPIQTYLP